MSQPSVLPSIPAHCRSAIEQATEITRTVIDEHVGLRLPSVGPADAVIATTSVVNGGLTLWPAIDAAHQVEAIVLKNVNWLWNISVDDAIDRDGSIQELVDSVLVLVHGKGAASTPTGRALGELLERARALGRDVTPLAVAIGEVLTGFHYRYAVRTRPEMGDADRYLHNSVRTISLEPHLAIDVLASHRVLAAADVQAASRTYHELSIALRYALDCGGVAHERRRGTLNIIEAWRRAGVGDVDVPRNLAPERAHHCVERARELAAVRPVPGLDDVVRSAGLLAASLLEGNPFVGV